MKISATTLGCPGWSLDEILDKFPRYGYDAVDFRGLGEEMEIWRLDEFSTHADTTVARIAEAGLAVSAFSSSARMFWPKAEEREKQVAEVGEYGKLCRKFSAGIIRVFGGGLEGTPVEQAIEIAVGELEKMAAAAGEGVIVAVETHDDWIDTGMLKQVLDRAAAPNVAALWDLHHPFRMGGESPRQSFDNIGARTVSVHLKDSRPLDGGEHEYCLVGEGDVPLREMIDLLVGAGYDGYWTLEWEKKWHPEIPDADEAMPGYAKWIRSLGL